MPYPDLHDEYRGYAWRIDGGQRSHKELVVMTGWMATALSEWTGRCYVPTKKACPDIFTKVIGGNVANAFREITELCRNELHCRLPTTPEQKARFEALLPGALAIENYFLERYQHFLIENLASANPVRRRTSVIRLGEVRYPNNLSERALQNFEPSDESQALAYAKSLEFLKGR